MSGFTANIINLITDNLRDRYQSGFPILKELIQNADDAGAEEFIFGDHPGFPKASNPLLQGPGIFCYNDGEFKTTDKKAITSFAENSKAAEEGTIGKFGLGMKSVFHLCEAFFYIANDGEKIYREILNPWNNISDENIHSNWESASIEEWSGIENIVHEIAGDCNTWFFLWIPLRQKRHLVTATGEITGAIMERYPGDDGLGGSDLSFLRDSSLRDRLASILPLLPNLSTIKLQSTSLKEINFTLLLESDCRLERQAKEAHSTGQVYDALKTFHLSFHGKKIETDSQVVAQLKNHPKWPKSVYRDDKGHPRIAEDKSRAEGSVLICQQKQGKGKLSIQWALFLPLEDESHLFETNISNSLTDYTFYLHGQFFVDAGRRGIFAYNQMCSKSSDEDLATLDDIGLRSYWNKNLAQTTTLPLFIPALEGFIQQNNINDQDTEILTFAIVRAAINDNSGQRFLGMFTQSICANYSWCRLIEPETQAWRKIDHSIISRLLPLPPPPKVDPARPWSVLPLLSSMEPGTTFVDASAPDISSKIEQWTERDIQLVLSGDMLKTFSSSTHLEYLASFIECAAGAFLFKLSSIQKIILSLLREAFRNTPISVLRQNRQRVVNIVKFLLPENRLSIGTLDHAAMTAIPDQIYSALWKHDTDVIIVPKEFDYNEIQATAKPHRADITTWLRTIHSLIESPSQNVQEDRCLDVANQLLNTMDDNDKAAIIRTNSELRILQATDARSIKVTAVSFASLETARLRNNLFGSSPGITLAATVGLAQLLADVIPEEQILVINSKISKTYIDNSENLPSSGSAEAILASLGATKKKLGDLTSRRKLIEQVANPGQNPIARKGLRYLLHGDESFFSDTDTPLWVAKHHQSLAWEKLWRQVSHIDSDDAWNILGQDLVQYVLQARWDFLGIKEIEPCYVVDELGVQGADLIETSLFSDVECEEILAYVSNESIWTNLPFHSLKGGGRTRIESTTFLDTGKQLPPDLAALIRIVEKSRNTTIQAKQNDWIHPLDESSIIKIALGSKNLTNHWRLITDILGNSHDTLCIESCRVIRETCWLPLKNGNFIRPSEVINIQQLSEDVQILAAKADYCYADVADLSEEILNSSALEILKTYYFLSADDAMEALGLLMAEIDGYEIGEIDLSTRGFELNQVAPALAKVVAMPSWRIINRVSKEFGEEKCLNYLLPAISKPVASEKIVTVLQSLAADCLRTNNSAWSAFHLYLRTFSIDQPGAKANLARLTLKARSGIWRPACELCTGAADVDAEHVLDNSLADILSEVVIDAGQPNAASVKAIGHANIGLAIQSAPGVIERYFNNWKGLVRDELLGAFLCLLGPSMRDLATYYLCGHTFEWVVSQIGWKAAERIDINGNVEWVRDYMPAERLEALAVGFRTVDEDRVTVQNLLGDDLVVHLSNAFSTIIAGAPCWEGNRRVYFPLRTISPARLSEEDLPSLIKETTKYILDKCYYQPRAVLDGLWQELEKTDQLQIDVVRGMILDHLPFYLRQLNANHKSDKLKIVLEKYDQARERLQEYKNTQDIDLDKLSRLSQELDNQLRIIAGILQNDEATQKAVLESLKQKLKDFQYDTQCLPFELFQNADDAAIELGLFDPDDDGRPLVPVPSKKLVVQFEGKVIRFMHWGRMVNSKGPFTKNGETRGFHRDLEKMLVLSSSDKPIGEGVTGKFGLGFKSVFLCCDKPCIKSGDLRVEIVGGVLPQLWNPSPVTVERLNHFSEDRNYKGTLIELQLSDEVSCEEILTRFRNLVGLLSVFGRAIRRIVVASSDNELMYGWNPVVFSEGVEIGRCELPENIYMSSRVGVVFRLKSGTVFFSLTPEGFTPLPKDIPSIWVTAPTREEESLGFAVSAAFSLDAGRGRLAGESAENRHFAEKIGRELGVKITSLIDRFNIDLPAARQQFHLTDNVSPAGFLATIWRTFAIAANSREGTGICSSIAVNALKKLCASPIPNGLQVPFEQSVPLDNIYYELSGPWVQREILQQLTYVGIAVEHCIASDIALLLRRSGFERTLSKLDFSCMVRMIDKKQCINNTAVILETIAALVWDQLKEEEKRQAADELALLLFENAAGEWKASRELLCAGIGDREEELRVQFAPDSAKLNDSYDEMGRAFFKRSRVRYDAPTELLVEWIRIADSDTKRQAALHYLIHGELGYKVGRCLRQAGIFGTWLAEIRGSHPYLESWLDSEIDDLLRMLVKEVYFEQPESPFSSSPKVGLIPKNVLNAIYDWWQINKREQIALYERKVFPGGIFPLLDFDFLKKEPEARKGWLTLFLLGAFHTIGRTKPEQHRSFINLCQTKGWMDRFVTVDQAGLDEWMTVIKNYLQDEIQDPEYYHWMKEFVSIFLLGYWLDEYVDSFMAIDKMRNPFSLKQITSPRINPAFQGGGPDAPPIDRALGMGACFVMRELARKAIISNQLAHQFCYVPRRPVCDLLEVLGCHGLNNGYDHETRSKMIHEFVCQHLGKEKATFDNSFDLPLWIVASDTDLQNTLFASTLVDESEFEEESEYVQ